ncbi:MAG: hypothetical protein H6548_12170 [Chitinophagales bacterium]|nr:hypothetical protein [Chitinophagales bacterium]MCB9022867.1 hypothetical protein [Chitinophagales bacterium]HPE98422.1 hypothetical protein [Chitinophagales bacterium]HPR29601.1 hypothetical protein [Chitinophagales bacterium]HQU40183.1 hypothetical protein [Chitinophagales bacterium]
MSHKPVSIIHRLSRMLPIALLLVAGYTVGIMSRTIYQDLSGTFQKHYSAFFTEISNYYSK